MGLNPGYLLKSFLLQNYVYLLFKYSELHNKHDKHNIPFEKNFPPLRFLRLLKKISQLHVYLDLYAYLGAQSAFHTTYLIPTLNSLHIFFTLEFSSAVFKESLLSLF